MAREKQLLERGVSTSQCLYLDEIALRKGHGKFETVIATEHRVLTLVEGKASASIQAFLKCLPGIERIGQVSMDMCASFAHAVKQVIPKAIIVVDRFHLIRKLNDALDQVRKKTHTKLDEKQRKRFAHLHFLLGQAYQQLTRDEKRLVRDYLRLNPLVKGIYWKCQEFRQILFYPWKNREDAYKSLWDWCERNRKYLPHFVKTIEQWWNPVLNACLFAISNGRQEGINNKIKLIKRQGFGYTNRQTFKLKVLAAFNP